MAHLKLLLLPLLLLLVATPWECFAFATGLAAMQHHNQRIPLSVQTSNGAPKAKFTAHQVPGDGSCLFHSVAVALRDVAKIDTVPCSDKDIAALLRHKAVEVLSDERTLLEVSPGFPRMSAGQLVSVAASDLGIDPAQYCTKMRSSSTWGGGPEIVALCHYLRLPIAVYSLESRRRWGREEFVIAPVAKFGVGAVEDGPAAAGINVLHCDGRFPHALRVGQESSTADHFMPLLPIPASAKGVWASIVGAGAGAGSAKDGETAMDKIRRRARVVLHNLALEHRLNI